ncbi:hypothetical protein ACFLQR_04200, partial [Verrucomicrobiota bacterium]
MKTHSIALLFMGLSCLLFVGIALAGTTTWEGDESINWATAGNWTAGVPASDSDVIIDGNYSGAGYTNPPTLDVSGGSVTIKSLSLGANNTSVLTIAFGSPTEKFVITDDCTIGTNGTLTHTTNYNAETHRIFMDVGNNLTIAQGGQINVTGKGYTYRKGDGQAGGNGGGGYGGEGGGAAGGTTYGSITAPVNIGSGGFNPGAYGGGAVSLTVTGTTTVDGTISAVGVGLWNDASSGGSVFITASAITGSGTIQADGGDAAGTGGRGGGGRIAVILTNDTDFGSITIQAYGGSTGNNKGAAGTIYLETYTDTPGEGELIVNNNNVVPLPYFAKKTVQNGVAASSYTFSRITLTNSGVYALDSDDTLDVTGATITGDPDNEYEGIYVDGGTLTISSGAFTWTNYFIGLSAPGVTTFDATTSLTIGSNATLIVDTTNTLNCPVTVLSGGQISHTPNWSAEQYKIYLTINGDLD